jgi:hypothetical protein
MNMYRMFVLHKGTKCVFICKISGSHSIKYEDDSFLGCSTISSCGSRLTFQGVRQGLMIEAIYTSGTSVYFHKTTWHYIPESCHLHVFILLMIKKLNMNKIN